MPQNVVPLISATAGTCRDDTGRDDTGRDDTGRDDTGRDNTGRDEGTPPSIRSPFPPRGRSSGRLC